MSDLLRGASRCGTSFVSILLLVGLVGLVGCSSDTKSSGTSTGGASGATTGGSDDGATGGTTGDNADGTGVDGGVNTPAPCESDADCEIDGYTCDCIGRCVPPGVDGLGECAKDINCGSENYCDTCASVCRPKAGLCEPCEADNACQDGGACLDFASGGRFCLRACVADPGCPQSGYSCREVQGADGKQCMPLSGQCTKPEVCLDDTECSFGNICQQGICKEGCPDDAACADGLVCTAFRCVEACSESNPCPEGQDCEEGHCRVEGGCVEPAECPEPETFCDLEQLMCMPGCQADFDCKSSGQECVGGSCVAKGCTANFFCAFEEVCDLATGQCVKAEGPYCEEGCDPQSDASCGGEANPCLSLQDDEGNALGDFCFVACGPDPNNPCPQGYACQEVELEEGVPSKLCFRDCTTKPVGVE